MRGVSDDLIPTILFEAVGAPDAPDFETLYLRYREALWHAAMRILRDQARAEDAVHDAFLTLAKRFAALRTLPAEELERYLFAVTRYKALALLREQNRFAELPETLPAPQDDGRTELERLMDALPPEDAALLRLRFVEGYTTREIASMLRISQDAARMRVKRAKDRLREILIKNGYEEYFK